MNHILQYNRRLLVLAGIMLCISWYSTAAQQNLPERVNLGGMVNSEYDEVLPVIAPDAQTLFFVRKNHPDNLGDEKLDDIWFSRLQPDSSWGPVQNIGRPLNTDGFNFVCTVMPDNNTMLLGNQYLPGGGQDEGVSLTRRIENGWSTPENLMITNLANLSRWSEYTMSPDGRVLIMSILRSDSIGGRDLYVSFREDKNIWTEPENLGHGINSVHEDITPFLAADGITLYFSSNRPGGFGNNDVYFSRRQDGTWKNWSNPRNLGYPINTPGWDAYYTVPANGEYAYFVSTNHGFGKSDIWRVELPEELRPVAVMLVSGKVRNVDGDVVPATISYERLSDGKSIGTATVDPETGQYKIALPLGHDYGFHAESDGYYPVSEHLDLTELEGFDEVQRDLVLAPLLQGTSIRLNNIFFDFDQDVLRDESKPELDRLANLLRSRPSMIIQIDGHTDSKGGYDYNIDLSRRRAQAVVNYLVSQGIAEIRLLPRGFGKTRPVATNDTDEGRQLNRRVEYTILQN
ncbi:MAG: flagellar motor protein MotB [Ignavibacteria bacterium]|nr:MAG: flagellar motor protein MotB [Ignavibacteria bacterium]